MKIAISELLHGPFVHLEQAFRRVPKIMQNCDKMHLKSPQNEHEETWVTVSQRQNIHPIAWRARTRQNAITFAVHGLALLRESVPTSRKLTKTQNGIRSQKWTPISNARREAGQFEVYTYKKCTGGSVV